MDPILGFIGTYNPAGGGGVSSLQAAYNGGNAIQVDMANLVDINRDYLNELYNRNILTIDQLAIGSLNNGAYIGRTKIADNMLTPMSHTHTFKWNDLDGGVQYRVAMSGDGRVMLACDSLNEIVNVSTDYGDTWNSNPFTKNGKGVAVSADGSIMAILSGSMPPDIYISYDYGVTWNGVRLSESSVNCVAMSADGRIMAVTNEAGSIDVSWNYGVDWSNVYAGADSYQGIAMSSDGKIMIATSTAYTASMTEKPIISYNYGVTWITADDFPDFEHYSAVAISANGRYMLVGNVAGGASPGGPYYVSNNYGQTFGQIANVGTYGDAAMSSDGKIMVILSNASTGSYISYDYGVTWGALSMDVASYHDVDMSSDGSVMIFGENGGGIYISKADTYINAANLLTPINTSAIPDANMPKSTYSIYMNEGTELVTAKFKKSTGLTFTAAFMHGKKIVEKILIPVVSATGSTTSAATTNAEAQTRASFILDLNASRWSSIGTPVIKFRVVGREQTGGNTAHFILYNKTDGANIAGSEVTTVSTAVYTVTEVTIPVANFPNLTTKVIQLRTWTTVAGTVELYSAEIEIEWTLF